MLQQDNNIVRDRTVTHCHLTLMKAGVLSVIQDRSKGTYHIGEVSQGVIFCRCPPAVLLHVEVGGNAAVAGGHCCCTDDHI